MAQEERLVVDGIDVWLTRKHMKTIRMKVRVPGGRVVVSAPIGAPMSAITAFVTAHRDWIEQHQARIAALPPPPEGPQYVTGERHRFLGQEYPLTVREAPGHPKVTFTGESIEMRVPVGSTPEQRAAVLHQWYADELIARTPALLERWEAVLGVRASKVTFKAMRTRWGSCTPTTRRISLNIEHAKYPIEHLEHTIVHELTHILHPNHGPGFYAVMDRALPEWRALRKAMGDRE